MQICRFQSENTQTRPVSTSPFIVQCSLKRRKNKNILGSVTHATKGPITTTKNPNNYYFSHRQIASYTVCLHSMVLNECYCAHMSVQWVRTRCYFQQGLHPNNVREGNNKRRKLDAMSNYQRIQRINWFPTIRIHSPTHVSQRDVKEKATRIFFSESARLYLRSRENNNAFAECSKKILRALRSPCEQQFTCRRVSSLQQRRIFRPGFG